MRVNYKGFAIIPAPMALPNGRWRLQGAIARSEGAGVGALFESQNEYSTQAAAERHFVDFAQRYIDGTATRADIDLDT